VRLDPDFDAESLAPTLADDGVHVSVRGDAVRVSAHAFNTLDDAARLVTALGRALGRST
jgi:selenocysteine lyase/cysteine desulfurase